MAGQTPFHDEDHEGDFDFYALLKAQKAGVPPGALPAGSPVSSLQFIWHLLKVDPEKRLGSGGAEEVRNHTWFTSVDFDFQNLRRLQLEAPFLPKATIPTSPAPEMWNKKGAPIEVLITEERDVMLMEDGDRYQKELKVDQAI